VNINMRNLRHVLSVGLAAGALAVVLTYVLGAHALLQTPQAEEGHNVFMSMFKPLIQGITGGHSSMSQMHGGPQIQDQTVSQSPTQGLIGNNILGSPATLPAGGLAVIVVASAIGLAAAAFIVSWKQRSLLVAGLLAASGIILMILPLATLASTAVIVFPGPILGVIFGLVIFGLGLAKGIRSAAPTAVAARRSRGAQ
jgi:hypothetical protein